MHHNGAGVITSVAPGSMPSVRTTPTDQEMIQLLRFAQACASDGHHVSASCVAPSSIVKGTHGTIARFAGSA